MRASSTEVRARELENRIAQATDLLAEGDSAGAEKLKKKLYNDVGSFLSAGFSGRHWWCTYPGLMTFMMRVLELYPTVESVRHLYAQMAQQLAACTKCVDVYHASLPSVQIDLEYEFTLESIKIFFHQLSELDAERIHRVFALRPTGIAADDRVLAERISVTLYEVLSQRRLLSDFRVLRVFSRWISTPLASSFDTLRLELLRGCSGLYHLLVSPDPGVRSWATSVVNHTGRIDLTGDSGHDKYFMIVLDEWMYILESASFNTPVLSLGLPSTEELDIYLDENNCAKTPTNQILWAALDTVMQQMDENSLETMLESFDNLPDLVFNTLDEAEPATTKTNFLIVICRCYKVLLRCLGHRFWKHTVHSPRMVLTLILDHCKLSSWQVGVTKHMIELLPPLLAAMRPPQASREHLDKDKLKFYLDTRDQLIKFLIHPKHRPSAFSSSILFISASRAMMTIVGDCYEHRQARSSIENEATKAPRDDGALPESSTVDYSVSENAFWWPCGSDSAGNRELEALWMNHLFEVVKTRGDNFAFIDHAVLTCSVVLRKHLQLARDALYSCITNGDANEETIVSLTSGKPIATILLKKLCAFELLANIPLTVHGALFESIGGVAELLNVIAAQPSISPEVRAFVPVLSGFETHLLEYFMRMFEEVLVKGLTNPLRFPVVAQHLSVCLLSPSENMDKPMKKLLGHLVASKDTQPSKVPSPLEAFLISAHRNTEAFLRGVLSLLQTLRLHNFALPVSAPTLKKVVFNWSKVFELLGSDVQKAIEKETPMASPDANVQRVPILINDFLVAVFSSLFIVKRETNAESPPPSFTVDEATRVRCLEFAISFWKFWTSRLESDMHSLSKRASGVVEPLVMCLTQTGSPSEKARAAQLLSIVLEHFVTKRTTALDEETLCLVESAQSSMATIDSERAATMPRVIKKLRQLDKSSSFFGKHVAESKGLSTQTSGDRAAGRVKSLASSMYDNFFTGASASSSNTRVTSSASSSMASSRPMSSKAAARAKARMATVDLTGVTTVSNEAAARKSHSFYDEGTFAPPASTDSRVGSQTGSGSSKAAFSVAEVVKGMSKVHPGSSRRALHNAGDQRSAKAAEVEEEGEADDEEDEEPNLRYAALFHRIRSTQKPIPVCSLLPFYRQLLQLCMPALLTHEFERDQSLSKRELKAPALSFGKSSEYVNAFLPLLLEECNNDVQEGLLQSIRHGGGHLMRYESEKAREGMRCLSFSLVKVDEGTRTSMNTKFDSNRFRGPMKPTTDKLFRNGDIVLLRAATNRANSSVSRGKGKSSGDAGFLGNREFVGVIMVSETEKGKRLTTMPGAKKDGGGAAEEEDIIRVLFLNDGELDTATNDRVASFEVEMLSASAMADTEWRVQPASNVVTSAREYIALRSVDLLPEHLRSTILTPNVHKSTQTDIIAMSEALDSLRARGTAEPDTVKKILKLLKRLNKLEITLTDLRSTGIGKIVNKLRKHGDDQVCKCANALKNKWTALMDQTDSLESAPRFLAPDLWHTLRSQYNQSQLQSIHSVLNNYGVGVSLLQGPPGTGKTKTIMALLSGFLSLRPPASALMSSLGSSSSKSKGASENHSQSAKAVVLSRPGSAGTASSDSVPAFSLGNTLSVSTPTGSILRRTDAPAPSAKRSTIQSLKNVSSVRSRLEHKLSSTSSRPAASGLVVRRRVVSSVLGRQLPHRTNHLLLCAPSNGAVNELILRIVTDGLLDATGAPVKVRAPSVHHEASNCDWISIVRLGNPGIDAAESVAAVSLPSIVKREMDIHPKNIELRSLQDTQRKLRASIREFHQNVKEQSEAAASGEGRGGRPNRKALAKMHSELTSVSGKIRRLRDKVFELKTKLTETVLSRASIIACTLSKAGSGPFNSLKRGFDALIIDEAAQAVELSTLVPLRERVARVVLVGDPKQLPATVKSVNAARGRYDRSLFERIADCGVAPSILRVQYRMHPFLREFPSKRFYNGMLTDGPSVMERVQRMCPRVYAMTCFQPFLLYDVPNSREEEVNGSKWNRIEAQFCVQICETMFNMCADVRMHKWSVGFVSPYREQVNAIRRELSRTTSAFSSTLSIEVNTVDGFQGREKDVIIFSCVRSSQRGGIGFLRDIRRLNVAITRARFCLFVVGDVRTLVRDDTWHALVRSARERKLVIETSGDPFPDVVKRLDSSEHGKELAQHYQEMHEKAARKASGTGNSSGVKSESSSPDKRAEEIASAAERKEMLAVKEGATIKEEPAGSVASSADSIVKHRVGETASTISMSKETVAAIKLEPGVDVTASTKVKREGSSSPAGRASTVAATKIASSTDSSMHLKNSTTDISSKGSIATSSSHHADDTMESTRHGPKRRADREDSGDRHRKHVRADQRDSDRGYRRGEHATSRNDERSSSARSSVSREGRSSSQRHHYDRHENSIGHRRDRSRSRGRDSRRPPPDKYGDNSDNDSQLRDRRNKRDRHSSSRSEGDIRNDRDQSGGSAMLTSAALPSISAKAFCMENEPAPPSAKPPSHARSDPSDKTPSWLRNALGKRPLSATGAHPPLSMSTRTNKFQAAIRHDRPARYEGNSASSVPRSGDSSRSDNRRVEYTSRTARPHQTTERRRPVADSRSSSRSGDVLGSILEGTSKLATSTSRVHSKTNRTNEF